MVESSNVRSAVPKRSSPVVRPNVDAFLVRGQIKKRQGIRTYVSLSTSGLLDGGNKGSQCFFPRGAGSAFRLPRLLSGRDLEDRRLPCRWPYGELDIRRMERRPKLVAQPEKHFRHQVLASSSPGFLESWLPESWLCPCDRAFRVQYGIGFHVQAKPLKASPPPGQGARNPPVVLTLV
jgi:hypothetical protein